jgi:predicted RNA-binding protein YlxR (DUF448 family)
MTERKRLQKPDKREKELKRCIVTNVELPRDTMVRFVVSPDEEIVADIEARLPGRGFWLSARRDVINKACTKTYFARAARAKVSVSSNLADRVERLLVRRCQDLIGLARRAGQVVSGFSKVEAWLRSGKTTGVLLTAVDGAEDGKKRIKAWTEGAPVIVALNAEELGLVFSRDRVVYVIVAPGRLAKKLLATAQRLEGLRC